MNKLDLEPGLYVNIFKVNKPDNLEVTVFTTSASAYPDLRDLRSWISQTGLKAQVYRAGNHVFGYGEDAHKLASKGFQMQKVRLFDHPGWFTRLIKESFGDHLKNKGYRELGGKVGMTLYEPNYQSAAGGKLLIYRGYYIRAIYLGNHPHYVFGLIIDCSWRILDANGHLLDTSAIKQYNAVTEVAQIQGELLPTNQINPEISRLRLRNHILPFVTENKEFALILGEKINASLEESPTRIILGV